MFSDNIHHISKTIQAKQRNDVFFILYDSIAEKTVEHEL